MEISGGASRYRSFPKSVWTKTLKRNSLNKKSRQPLYFVVSLNIRIVKDI